MPKSKKKGKKGISENIKIEMRSGKPKDQAIAIAMSRAKKKATYE
jgi:hypothetical protein